MFVLALILALCTFATGADAAIYKYVDSNGAILFTDTPVNGCVRVMKDERRAARRKKAVRAAYKDNGLAGGYARASLSGRTDDVDRIVERKAQKYSVDPHLVKAVIKAESGYDRRAISPKGAMGLMQLMPQTANSMGVYNPFDPEENIEGGVKYLSSLIDRFGNVTLALAAYNAGPSCVEKHGAVPPYRETEDYVRKILAMYKGKDYPPDYGYDRTAAPGTRAVVNNQKAVIRKKNPVIYKVVLKDGTVLYTNNLPSRF
ncbi:MAG: lytic transglycosylase domain-containing protein [Nitrospiraceae bacterium]|nr:lytic transglycosylase domain-containing protein [Nitrospiraceae bacterium]